jgi:hypothetical protein
LKKERESSGLAEEMRTWFDVFVAVVNLVAAGNEGKSPAAVDHQSRKHATSRSDCGGRDDTKGGTRSSSSRHITHSRTDKHVDQRHGYRIDSKKQPIVTHERIKLRHSSSSKPELDKVLLQRRVVREEKGIIARKYTDSKGKQVVEQKHYRVKHQSVEQQVRVKRVDTTKKTASSVPQRQIGH